MPGILWLASYPKSGNTWMRAFLANLIADRDEPLDLNRIGELCTSEANGIWGNGYLKKAGDNRKVSDLTNDEILELRLRFQAHMVASNRMIVPAKTHNFMGAHNGKPLFNMDVTQAAIYILRDPRDVALSFQHHLGKSLDYTIDYMASDKARSEAAPGMIYEFYSSWSNHVESWTRNRHPKIIVLRYEDMVADPFGVFVPLAKKLGITKDEGRIKKAIEFSSFKVLQKLERETGFVEQSEHNTQFFRSGKKGDWEGKLTETQQQKIEQNHGKIMKQFKYLG
ncbi:sulfotransferase domain-containing protein [Kiloniella sp. b19]|uniref:sulfotransferase domain-containing protein n=1 Tax=Kiloniella sp. GXU_MW_B19 TaxID=3141326 RepID=UPI0031DDE537